MLDVLIVVQRRVLRTGQVGLIAMGGIMLPRDGHVASIHTAYSRADVFKLSFDVHFDTFARNFSRIVMRIESCIVSRLGVFRIAPSRSSIVKQTLTYPVSQ